MLLIRYFFCEHLLPNRIAATCSLEPCISSIRSHAQIICAQGLACRAQVTTASSPASPCSGEVFASPACHTCGCTIPFRVHFWPIPYRENIEVKHMASVVSLLYCAVMYLSVGLVLINAGCGTDEARHVCILYGLNRLLQRI